MWRQDAYQVSQRLKSLRGGRPRFCRENKSRMEALKNWVTWRRHYVLQYRGHLTCALAIGGVTKGGLAHRFHRFEAAQSLQGYASQRCSQARVPHIRHSLSPGAFTASSLPLVAFVQIPNLAEHRELSFSHQAEPRPGLRPRA